MIVKKDGFEFYADKNKNPDILLYAPNNQNKIYEYIIHNKIKKIALCGGGEPTQKYLDTIIDFEWLEYINGIGKKLDYRFINKLPNLKTYIGTLDFELSSKSVEEVYVDYNASGRILSDWNDTIKVQCLNCRKKEKGNEKVRRKLQGRGAEAVG